MTLRNRIRHLESTQNKRRKGAGPRMFFVLDDQDDPDMVIVDGQRVARVVFESTKWGDKDLVFVIKHADEVKP